MSWLFPHSHPDLTQPSLPTLAYVLRHWEIWPSTFGYWDWWDNRHCAMGLADCIWFDGILNRAPLETRRHIDETARRFGLTNADCEALFVATTRGRALGPKHVAKRIEAYLASTAEPIRFNSLLQRFYAMTTRSMTQYRSRIGTAVAVAHFLWDVAGISGRISEMARR
jgi:hypothetical protein